MPWPLIIRSTTLRYATLAARASPRTRSASANLVACSDNEESQFAMAATQLLPEIDEPAYCRTGG